jgi:hypothetical protein
VKFGDFLTIAANILVSLSRSFVSWSRDKNQAASLNRGQGPPSRSCMLKKMKANTASRFYSDQDTHVRRHGTTDLIAHAWGWTGIRPFEVVGQNDFGNLMVCDVDGKYWRLCPEDLYCRVVANTRSELDALSADQTFLHDWYMSALVEQAKAVAGPLFPGWKYCLKIPGPLGGEYGGSNLASISLEELIEASGYIAHQIEGLPDGAKVELRITE